MKYKITAVVEQDKDYSNTDQIKELVSDIQMDVASYNCFRIAEDVKVGEYKPDMREKVKEYISELGEEISRCDRLAQQDMEDEATTVAEMMIVRAQVLMEVKNDLKSRLEELI